MGTRRFDEFLYAGRYVWVDFKHLLRIPLKSDKAHLCDRIVRAIKKGAIHPDSAFTAGLRPDGLGAMILQRLSIQAAAQDMGFDYYHTPFGFVGHPETEPEKWSRRCEAEFELGHNFKSATECDLPYMEFSDYAKNEAAWRTPHLIGFREMFRYCNEKPDILGKLEWSKYYRSKLDVTPSDRKRIAVHVRRGDVSKNSTTSRYTENYYILNTIKDLISNIEKDNFLYTVEIYSNGTPLELSDFSERGYQVRNTLGALETFRALASADALVMAKSTFSYVAGLCSNGIVVYEDQYYAMLDGWIARRKDGSLAEDLEVQIVTDLPSFPVT